MESDLIDRIYESSVVPELWPSVLDELAQMTESRGGVLFSARKQLLLDGVGGDPGWSSRSTSTTAGSPVGPRRLCLMGQAAPSFFVEQDFWSEEQINVSPIYRDFFRPRGLGWSAGTGLQVPTGDSIVFSVERAFDRGPFEPAELATLNALRPHLARSALVSARLCLERAQGGTER